MNRKVALSIAGSDSGGGAGIQADLRVFSRLGVFGTTIITSVTAQNTSTVLDVVPLSAQDVKNQMKAVFDGFPVRAVKTGMLWSAEIVKEIAFFVERATFPPLVVDPVMVATSGSRLLKEEAVEVYKSELIPRAALLTPNVPEAEILLETEIKGAEQMEETASRLSYKFGCAVLLKGGHLPGDVVNVLSHQEQTYCWTHPRVEGVNTHGTGCMLSAAVTAYLAKGVEMVSACQKGIEFVSSSLSNPIKLAGELNLAGIENV